MKDTLCSYYTESDDITSYMVSKVTVSDGDVILEPSAGEGIFIDELLKTNKSFRVDALDINGRIMFILFFKNFCRCSRYQRSCYKNS